MKKLLFILLIIPILLGGCRTKETNSEENNKTTLDDEDTGEIILDALEIGYGDLAEVTYEKEQKKFLIDLQDDATLLVLMLEEDPENEAVVNEWKDFSESFRSFSGSLSENCESGFQFQIVHPENKENIVLSITDGVITYNILDDL